MDLLTIIQTVFRRWYVAFPIGLVALAAAGYLQLNLPSEYEAQGSVLLEEPQFDPSRLPTATVNADALIERLESGNTLSELASGGAQILPVAPDPQTIEVTAAAGSDDAAEASVETTLDWLTSMVTDLQAEVEEIAEDERLQPVVLTPAITAEMQDEDRYTASGTLYLRDPSGGAENPYQAAPGTAQLLQEVIASDQGRMQISERTAPGVAFAVTSDRDSGPIMNVALHGPEPAALLDAYGVVTEALNTELDQRQARADVAQTRRIVVRPLAVPQSVADVSPPLDRTVAAVVGVGGMLALGMTLALDSFLSRRRVALDPPSTRDADDGAEGAKSSSAPPTPGAAGDAHGTDAPPPVRSTPDAGDADQRWESTPGAAPARHPPNPPDRESSLPGSAQRSVPTSRDELLPQRFPWTSARRGESEKRGGW